jgi:short-subunit dehydrogenase
MSKTVVISGASSGIGFTTAEFLQAKGFNVIGLSRNYPKKEYKFNYFLCDITKEDQVIKVCDEIKKNYDYIDVLINCAGMGVSGAIEHSSITEVRKIFDVNVYGQFLLTKHLIELLRKSNGGKIINVGSVAGEIIIPFQTFYSMTKAAISAFSEGLRIELKPFNIQVTTILPGDIKTGFTENREMPIVVEDKHYKHRIKNSIAKMAKDEQQGMPAIKVSKVILNLIKRKHLPVAKTIGFKYKLFVLLAKILPKSLLSFVVRKMYGE